MSRRLKSRVTALAVTCTLASAIVLACGGSSNSNSGWGDNGSSGGSGGSGSGGSSGSLGGNGNGGGNGSGSGSLGGGNGGPGNADAACAASSSKGQQAPLDIYMMLDYSGSMKESTGSGTKWSSITNAMNAFVSQPLSGVSVGLQYFGLPPKPSDACTDGAQCQTDSDCGSGTCSSSFLGKNCICSTDSCKASDYATSEVEIAPLPGVAAAIKSSLAGHTSPYSSTPTSAALQGAIDHATAWAKAHPNDATIALLATDGDPTECDTNLQNIDAIASKAAAGTPKILTFVIGVGSSLSNLNGIAAAGGTGQAYLVDTAGNAQQQFLDALNKIRGTALGCTYAIPMPASGSPNYDQVNVQWTPAGGQAQTIPRVNGKAACPATGNAWYYDNPAAPKQIILCDATCTAVTSDKNGEVDVLTGCATIVK